MAGTMSRSQVVFLLVIALTGGGALLAHQSPLRGSPTDANGECPAGMTEVRPGNCVAPSQPPPSIVDYRPKTTLVTEQHLVPKAKFPVVDIHGHPGPLTTPEAIERVVKAMDSLTIAVLVSADNTSGQSLKDTMAALAASAYKERFRVLCGADAST
jgi:hypothetical protein